MAVLPLSTTNVRVFSDVPFTADQQNVRWFQNISSQDSYFNNLTPILTVLTNTKIDTTEELNIFKITVKGSIDSLINANYLMFVNSTKKYYCFIIFKERSREDLTTLYIKLDVMQTYMFNFTFKPSYVAREHTTLWQSSNIPVKNTIDEGLNYGTEYDIVHIQHIKPSNNIKFLVVVCKQAIHYEFDPSDVPIPVTKEVKPTFIGSPQPLTYYLLPYDDNEIGVSVTTTAPESRTGIVSNANWFLQTLYKTEDATNNIVSIYMTEHCGLSYITSSGSPYNGVTFNNTNDVKYVAVGNNPQFGFCLYVENVPHFSDLGTTLPNIYNNLKTVTESKLLMYPYTKMLVVDMKGNQAEYKLEEFTTRTPVLLKKGSLGTSNKISVSMELYNTSLNNTSADLITDRNGFINVDPQDLPVVTDLLNAFMQGNRNSIQNDKNSAIFNGVMGMTSSVIGGMSGVNLINPIGSIGSVGGGFNSMISSYGNMRLQLEGFNAKQQDIGNLPPDLTKQGSNIQFSEGNGHEGVFIIKLQIKDEYINTLSDYFKMYGYKVNKVKTPNLRTRTNWNYVECPQPNIIGSVGNEVLIEIKSIFKNGVTLWHTNDICNYSLPNGVI